MAPDEAPLGIENAREAQEARGSVRWALAIILAATAIVFVAGATSDVVKGDEAYYYMFADAWFHQGVLHRPAYNPIYESAEAGYYFTTEPLWPFVCSLVWHVTGVHAWSAQAFQAGFYALLLAAVYGLGRDLLGPRGALAAMLAAVSVPMFGAFSILLYTDVPVTVLLILAVVLLRKEQFLAAGVVMGLAYLTKRNAAFLAPACLAWMLWTPGTFWERVRRVGVFVMAAGAVTLPDFLWRQVHIPSAYEPVSICQIIQRLVTRFSQRVPDEAFVAGVGGSGGSAAGWWDRLGALFALRPGLSRINHVGSWVQYGGVVILVLLGLYVVRRAWRRGDGWLWICVGSYMAVLLLQFTWDTEVRYTMPAVALAAVLVARGLERWWRKGWVLGLVGVVAFGHLGATAWYTKAQRTLTPGQRAVFEYLRTRTPLDARILYPGEVLILQARRQAVWSQLRDPKTGCVCITGFLSETDPEQIRRLLRANAVTHICVDERRVYADRGEVVGFGYPRSFVERLPTLPFLERVEGDWPGVELWRVKGETGGEAPVPPSGAKP
jgi:4-amino-4-deoxy-L-arabinose transferase-like glycosyltransferase